MAGGTVFSQTRNLIPETTFMAAFVFWFSAVLVFYIYAGYPLLVWLLARLRPRPARSGPFEGRASVLIAIHNESFRLGPKLQSLLAAEGSERICEVIVGSDGSTDHVAAAIATVKDSRVRLVEFERRRGKPSVLNDLMGQARGDVVVFTDARQPLEKTALRNLLSNFADERVGVVSGELVLRARPGDTAAARGVGAYWRYEKFIRRSESLFRSVPGATGAFYAIRRDLLSPIPSETILDDVAIPLQAVAQGFRCVFEEGAVAYDDPAQSAAQEHVRKRRTIAGNAQLVALFPWLMNPRRNPIWFEFLSHKLLRLVSPLLLAALLVASGVLVDDPLYRAALGAQLLFYLVAVAGALLQEAGLHLGALGVPFMFCALNWTTLLALGDVVRGRYRVTWARDAS